LNREGLPLVDLDLIACVGGHYVTGTKRNRFRRDV